MMFLSLFNCSAVKDCCITKYFSCENIRQLLASDFNRGYIAALSFVVFVLLVVLILRLLVFFVFRTRNCSRIVIPGNDGDIVVNRDAIEVAIRKELESFAQLEVRKMQLFRRGKNYSVRLCCTYDRNGEGAPQLIQELKPRLREVMKELFGIEKLSRITVCIEHLKEDGDDTGSPVDPISVPNAHFGI